MMLTHNSRYKHPKHRKIRNHKPIGEVLIEAGLLSDSQVAIALQEQRSNSQFLFGEIVALKGWLKRDTVNFFVREWQDIVSQRKKQPIGYYFRQAGLVDEEQILAILQEHQATGIRFGTVAVFQGFLSAQTLEFFLESLYPQSSSKLVSKKHRYLTQRRNSRSEATPPVQSFSKPVLQVARDLNQAEEEIVWIG